MTNFSEVLEELRQKRNISKQKLADLAGLTASYVSHLTLGSRGNPSEDTVLRLAHALHLDNEEKLSLFQAAGLSLPPPSMPIIPSTPVLPIPADKTVGEAITEDWDDIPNLQTFFGREEELKELEQWILQDRCQLVAVSGAGGIGKTMLAIKLARHIVEEFEYVFWRSLKDAPPLERILKDCIFLLSNQQSRDLPGSLDDSIRLLIHYLKTHRCLLILDNLEAVLQEKESAGEYPAGYEDYARLTDAIGDMLHQSCLILTTRETPKGIALQAGKTAPVRIMPLRGLKVEDGLKILEDKGLAWADQVEDARELVDQYAGNPLALKVAAVFIRDAFVGHIRTFLARGNLAFQDIRDVLEQQFERLSPLEQRIMYWLAIEREAISHKELLKDLLSEFAPSLEVLTLGDKLQSLRRRSLIEIDENAYSLQPAILEYMTRKLVERAVAEIERESIAWLESHALLKAQAKEYISDAQSRLILDPIAQQLHATYGREGCEAKLKMLLRKLHETPPSKPGYAAGNLLNLLLHMGYDLNGYDFSHLYVWQAYLQGAWLTNVNFAYANLERSVFIDNFRSILSVTLSPDNHWLAAGTENGEVRIWDASTGVPWRTYQGHTGRVRSVAFSPDGKTIISGSEDTTVRIWSIDTYQCLHILPGHTDRVRAVAMNPDGRTVLSGGDDCTVRVWDIETGQCLNVLKGHTDRVRAVVFSLDGNLIASAGEDGTIRLWNARSGQWLKTLTGHSKQIHSVNFSPDGTLIASAGEDQAVRIWDVESGLCLKTLQGHTNQVRSAVFSPDGKQLVSGSDDTTIRIWDVQSDQPIKTLQGHLHRVYAAAFSRDGRTIVSGSEDQTIRIWDVQSGQPIKTLQGYINQVRSVSFDPLGTTLLSGGDDHLLRLWDTQSGRSIRTFTGHTNGIRAVTFNHDGSRIASASDDRTVRIWDAQTGKCLRVLREHTDRVRTVAFSHDGKLLASGGEDQMIRIWNATTGQRLKVLPGHTDWVRSVAFSPDDKLLISGSEDATILVWDVDSGQCLAVLDKHTNGVRSVAFNPDGTLLASSSDDATIRLWETATWTNLKTLQQEDMHWLLSVVFSPDGTRLASGGEDQTVRIWDVQSGACLKTLEGHEHRVYSVAFHPDGRTLASGSLDGTIRLWDVETGVCITILRNSRPYEGMDITGVQGLTEEQLAVLKALGAIEHE